MEKVIDLMLDRNKGMIHILSSVVSDYEEFEGHIRPETYIKLKEFFGEEVPEEVKRQIEELDV